MMLGAYSRGPFTGSCRMTRSHASVCRVLNRLVHHLGGPHHWGTLALNLDVRLPPHRDSGNYPSSSLLIGLTHHVDGGVWIEDAVTTSGRAGNGGARCGSVYRMEMQSLKFPAHRMVHATCGWSLTNRIVPRLLPRARWTNSAPTIANSCMSWGSSCLRCQPVPGRVRLGVFGLIGGCSSKVCEVTGSYFCLPDTGALIVTDPCSFWLGSSSMYGLL